MAPTQLFYLPELDVVCKSYLSMAGTLYFFFKASDNLRNCVAYSYDNGLPQQQNRHAMHNV